MFRRFDTIYFDDTPCSLLFCCLRYSLMLFFAMLIRRCRYLIDAAYATLLRMLMFAALLRRQRYAILITLLITERRMMLRLAIALRHATRHAMPLLMIAATRSAAFSAAAYFAFSCLFMLDAAAVTPLPLLI